MDQINNYIKNFLLNYTFNNIDILLSNKKELKLDEKSLVDKIITKKRGGYCFENNQYFFNFLREKNYLLSRALARVVYGDLDNNKPRTHQLTLVDIDSEKYIADVGFGPYSPCGLVGLNGEEFDCFNGRRYRVQKIDDINFQLEILKDDHYFSLYQFDLASYNDSDFYLSNYYTNTHENSKFTYSLILSQQLLDGVVFFNNLSFTKINGNIRTDLEIGSSNELYNLITENFQVNLSRSEIEVLFNILKNHKV